MTSPSARAAYRRSMRRDGAATGPRTAVTHSLHDDVFTTAVRPVAQAVAFRGGSGTVVTFGQSGTGKTRLMYGKRGVGEDTGAVPLGDSSPGVADEGLVRATLRELFGDSRRGKAGGATAAGAGAGAGAGLGMVATADSVAAAAAELPGCVDLTRCSVEMAAFEVYENDVHDLLGRRYTSPTAAAMSEQRGERGSQATARAARLARSRSQRRQLQSRDSSSSEDEEWVYRTLIPGSSVRWVRMNSLGHALRLVERAEQRRATRPGLRVARSAAVADGRQGESSGASLHTPLRSASAPRLRRAHSSGSAERRGRPIAAFTGVHARGKEGLVSYESSRSHLIVSLRMVWPSGIDGTLTLADLAGFDKVLPEIFGVRVCAVLSTRVVTPTVIAALSSAG